jgi:hypothetical protein
MTKHIIIYSHGFGVQKDDRGLFTDITDSFPDAQHIMFDYNKIDQANNTLTVAPLGRQAEMLAETFHQASQQNPAATIDIIAHSQGCIVAGLAGLPARRTVLLAPPTHTKKSDDKIKTYIMIQPGTTVKNGVTIMPRRDGSTTIIGQDYWRDYDKIADVPLLYNALSKVVVISALEDEVIGEQKHDNIASSVKIIKIHADHNFSGDSRRAMIDIVKGILR